MSAAILAFALFVLVGCTYDEQRFFSALQQMDTINSFEAETQIAFEVQFSGGNEEFQNLMLDLQQVLDNVTISYNVRHEKVNNGYRMSLELLASLEGVAEFDIGMWSHFCPDTPIFHMATRIPAFLQESFPYEHSMIRYIEMDINNLPLDMEQFNDLINELTTSARPSTPFDIPDISFDMLYLMQVLNLWETSLVSSRFDENGQTVLTLSISDEQLKDAFVTFAYRMYTDEFARGYIVDWIELVLVLAGESDIVSRDGLESGIREFAAEVLILLEDYVVDFPLLGESGLVYSITLNENGYVIREDVSVELQLDGIINSIINVFARRFGEEVDDEAVGTVSFTIRTQTQYTNINAASLVVFPYLYEGNSINMYDIMSELAYRQQQRVPIDTSAWEQRFLESEQEREQFLARRNEFVEYHGLAESPMLLPITGIIRGEEIDSEILAMFVGSDIALSATQLAELFNGTITFDEHSGLMALTIPFPIRDSGDYLYRTAIIVPERDYYIDEDAQEFFGNLLLAATRLEGHFYGDTFFIPLFEISFFTLFREYFELDIDTGTIIVTNWMASFS